MFTVSLGIKTENLIICKQNRSAIGVNLYIPKDSHFFNDTRFVELAVTENESRKTDYMTVLRFMDVRFCNCKSGALAFYN